MVAHERAIPGAGALGRAAMRTSPGVHDRGSAHEWVTTSPYPVVGRIGTMNPS
jgi:hypothetical protein